MTVAMRRARKVAVARWLHSVLAKIGNQKVAVLTGAADSSLTRVLYARRVDVMRLARGH